MHRPLAAQAAHDDARATPSDATLAAARLFMAHGPFVLRVLPRLGVAEQDAQDVCQEVFLTAFRHHDRFDGTSRETTWLYGICLRVAANHRRKGYRRREQPHAEVPSGTHVDDSEAVLDARRLSHLLDAALERLPLKKREVFVLFEFAERDMEEIATIVSAPLKTCYSRLYAARAELQADLARQTATESKP